MRLRSSFLRVALLAIVSLLAAPFASRADDPAPEPSPAAAEMLKSMREKGVITEEEYQDLYRRQAKYEAEQRERSELPGWMQDWTVGGDFRLRYDRRDYHHGLVKPGQEIFPGRDNVDAEGDPNSLGSATGIQDRGRIRLRIGAEKRLGEGFTFGFRIATAEPITYGSAACLNGTQCGLFASHLAGNPRSDNVAMGGLWSTKSLFLDRVYVRWEPDFVSGLELRAGRFANPFATSRFTGDNLVWDPDLNPEGLAAQYHFEVVPQALWVDATGALFLLNDVASATTSNILDAKGAVRSFFPLLDERDPYMWGAQLAVTGQPIEWARATLRASYYKLQQLNTTFVAAMNDFGNRGDAVDRNPLLALAPGTAGFNDGASKGSMDELVGDVSFELTPFGETYKIVPFFNYMTLLNARSANAGYSVGLDLGTPDVLKLTVMYARLGANSTVSLFVDDDMFDGFTNTAGWVFAAERRFTRFLRVRASFSSLKPAQDQCPAALASQKLCDTSFAFSPELANAFRQTERNRYRWLVDMVVDF